jgi:hypothetical protein
MRSCGQSARGTWRVGREAAAAAACGGGGAGSAMNTDADAEENSRGRPAKQKTWEIGQGNERTAWPM